MNEPSVEDLMSDVATDVNFESGKKMWSTIGRVFDALQVVIRYIFKMLFLTKIKSTTLLET